MDKRVVILISLVLFFFGSCAFSQEQLAQNDYLYSEEYFDYLIQCANEDAIQKQNEEQQQEQEQKEQQIEIAADDSVTFFEFEDEICADCEPFKLKVEEFSTIGAYSETFKKEDTKTIIPVNNKFSFVQDTLKYKNRYNSDDYRVLAGVEVNPYKFLNLASGVEANYRGIDQNPTSRKLYFTPTININDKLSFSFYNKFDMLTNSTDHDFSVNISPLKSKAMDFKVYAGYTLNQDGTHSESINFYTNFYLF